MVYCRRLFIFLFRFRRRSACRGRSDVSRDYITDRTWRKYSVVVVVPSKTKTPKTGHSLYCCGLLSILDDVELSPKY